jgi:UDP-perosamine 4-acetyltransferase
MRILLWGAGGHGKVVYDVAVASAAFEEVTVIDDDPARRFDSLPVVGTSKALGALRQKGYDCCLISIGSNRTRARCFGTALAHGFFGAIAVHPSAILSPSATIGPGTVVMPNVVINAGARIGQNCIINTGAIVEHDCEIGDHVHISPRAVLGGTVTVGRYAHIGIGAVVLPGAVIGEEAVVGAGAVVLKEAPAHCTVVGVPAKVLVPA